MKKSKKLQKHAPHAKSTKVIDKKKAVVTKTVSALESKRVVVCGGAGFVGQNLIPILIAHRYSVVVLDKHQTNLSLLAKLNPMVKTVFADMSSKGAWMTAFEGCDYLIDLHAQIASPNTEDFVANNVHATNYCIEAAKIYGIKYIVHMSSAAVNSVRMDDYASTKKASEDIVVASGISYVSLRPSMMYGPFDNKNVGWLIAFARKMPFFPMPGTGKYPRQPVYVKDMCNLIVSLLAKQPQNKVYNINGDTIDFIDMVRVILREAKISKPIIKLPLPIFIAGLKSYNIMMRKVVFTPDQIKSLVSGDVFEEYAWWNAFGVDKTSFDDGMKDMMAQQEVVLER